MSFSSKFTLLCLLLVCTIESVYAEGWTDSGAIKNIVLEHRSGENDIYLSIASPIDTTCPNKTLIALSADSEEKLSRLYSMVLAAKASDIELSFFVSNECDQGGIAKTSMLKM